MLRSALAAALALAAAVPQPAAHAESDTWVPVVGASSGDISAFPNGVGYGGATAVPGTGTTGSPRYTVVSRTTDYGQTWTPLPPFASGTRRQRVVFGSPTTGWTYDESRTLSVTRDGGRTWSVGARLPLAAGQSLDTGEVRRPLAASRDGGVAIGGHVGPNPACLHDLMGTVYWSENGGRSFVRYRFPGVVSALLMADRRTGLAFVRTDRFPRCDFYGGTEDVYRTTDGSRHWTRVYRGKGYVDPRYGNTSFVPSVVDGALDGRDLWVLGMSDGTVLVTRDGGRSYARYGPFLTQPRTTTDAAPIDAVGVLGRTMYAAQSGSVIWRSADGGATWTQQVGPVPTGTVPLGLFDGERVVGYNFVRL